MSLRQSSPKPDTNFVLVGKVSGHGVKRALWACRWPPASRCHSAIVLSRMLPEGLSGGGVFGPICFGSGSRGLRQHVGWASAVCVVGQTVVWASRGDMEAN